MRINPISSNNLTYKGTLSKCSIDAWTEFRQAIIKAEGQRANSQNKIVEKSTLESINMHFAQIIKQLKLYAENLYKSAELTVVPTLEGKHVLDDKHNLKAKVITSCKDYELREQYIDLSERELKDYAEYYSNEDLISWIDSNLDEARNINIDNVLKEITFEAEKIPVVNKSSSIDEIITYINDNKHKTNGDNLLQDIIYSQRFLNEGNKNTRRIQRKKEIAQNKEVEEVTEIVKFFKLFNNKWSFTDNFDENKKIIEYLRNEYASRQAIIQKNDNLIKNYL